MKSTIFFFFLPQMAVVAMETEYNGRCYFPVE